MRFAQILQSLSLAALVLAAGLTLARTDDASASSDQVSGIAGTAYGRPSFVDDDGNLGCPDGHQLAVSPAGDYWELWDINANDHICLVDPMMAG